MRNLVLIPAITMAAILAAGSISQAASVTVTKTTRSVQHHHVSPVDDDRHGCYTKKVKVYHNGTYVWKTKRICT